MTVAEEHEEHEEHMDNANPYALFEGDTGMSPVSPSNATAISAGPPTTPCSTTATPS